MVCCSRGDVTYSGGEDKREREGKGRKKKRGERKERGRNGKNERRRGEG